MRTIGQPMAIVLPILDVVGEVLGLTAAEGVNISDMACLEPIGPFVYPLRHVANRNHARFSPNAASQFYPSPYFIAADDTNSVSSVCPSRIPHLPGEQIVLHNLLELMETGKSFNKHELHTQLPQLSSNRFQDGGVIQVN